MSRSAVNFVLDAVLAVSFLAVLWIQFGLAFLFPSPSKAGGWILWSLDYDAWARLSFWATFVFAVMILLHVMLHWSWVCGFVTHRLSKALSRKIESSPASETLIGVAILVLLLHVLGGLYLAALFTIRAPAATQAPKGPAIHSRALLDSVATRQGIGASPPAGISKFVRRFGAQ